MGAVTIRNIPDDAHLALEARAKRNGRSLEAEVIDILLQAASGQAASGQASQGIGSQLRTIGLSVGGVELDDVRERAAYTPPTFR